MVVVVLGGAGLLGRAVVSRLLARGIEARSASRRSGVDLASGDGLADVLDGADAVVHLATSPLWPRRVDVDGTRRLVDTVRASDRGPHLVYVSIVGCDVNPYPYYRAKTACEQVLAATQLPATVVRATQFHPLVAGLARAARPLGVGLGVRGVAAQPCDVGWVAGRVVDLATGPAPSGFVRSADLAGPERLELTDAVRRVATHDGARLWTVLTLPAVGRTARAFAAGSTLPGADAEVGGSGFASWLAEQPAR